MYGEKGALNSKGIQGAIVALLGLIALVFGWSPELLQQITNDVVAIMSAAAILLGLIFSIYGRWTSTTKITGFVKKDNSNNILPSALIFMMLLGSMTLTQGCAALVPTVTPETPEESLYMARAEYSAVLKTSTDLVESGLIDADMKATLGARFDDVETALDLAEVMVKDGLGEDARSQIGLALKLLTLIQEELPNGGT